MFNHFESGPLSPAQNNTGFSFVQINGVGTYLSISAFLDKVEDGDKAERWELGFGFEITIYRHLHDYLWLSNAELDLEHHIRFWDICMRVAVKGWTLFSQSVGLDS